MKSDKVSPFSEWILDFTYPYYICCRDELFDSLGSRKSYVHLSDGSSYAIKSVGIVILNVHDWIVRKLEEIRYIPSFNKNLISFNKLDSNDYKWKEGDRILKVIHGSMIDLQEKKYRILYLLIGDLVQDRVLETSRSSMR